MIQSVYTPTYVLTFFFNLVLNFIGHSRPRFRHLFNRTSHKLVIFLAQTLKADAVFVRYLTLSGLPQARRAHRARLPLVPAEDEISNLVQHILSFVLA